MGTRLFRPSTVNISGKPKGHGFYIKTLVRPVMSSLYTVPIQSPMCILNMALLSIIQAVAHTALDHGSAGNCLGFLPYDLHRIPRCNQQT